MYEIFTEPRDAAQVVEQAEIDYKTARKYLKKFVTDGRLRTVERYGVSFGDVNPVWILSECLANLPDRLRTFRGRLDEGPS